MLDQVSKNVFKNGFFILMRRGLVNLNIFQDFLYFIFYRETAETERPSEPKHISSFFYIFYLERQRRGLVNLNIFQDFLYFLFRETAEKPSEPEHILRFFIFSI